MEKKVDQRILGLLYSPSVEPDHLSLRGAGAEHVLYIFL